MWLQLVYGCLPSLSDGETVFRHACKLDLERHCLEAEGLPLPLVLGQTVVSTGAYLVQGGTKVPTARYIWSLLFPA
jgi:hypothetical protein